MDALMGIALGKGLLNMDPPEHGQHRKMWNPAFTSPAIEAYLPMLERLIAEQVRRWPRQESVDVHREMQTLTFAAAAWALAGIAPGPELTELGTLFHGLGSHRRRDDRVLAIIAERRGASAARAATRYPEYDRPCAQ
jgi:cytochrome P450